MRRLVIAVLVVCAHIVPGALRAEPLAVPPDLELLADAVMAGAAREQVRAAAVSAERAIEALTDPASRSLHNAQRLFLLGFDSLGRGDGEQGRTYVEASVDAARAALEIEVSSEGYRVLANAYNQLLRIRGRAYQAVNFRAARAAADQAVLLDRRNPLAHIAAASYYLSAPAIAGGDLRRGLEHVEAAARLSEEDRYVSFLVAIWAAHGAARTGAVESARRALSRAADIYPDNWWLADVREELGLGQ